MIQLRNLRLDPGKNETELKKAAALALRIDASEITGLTIMRKSLDARKNNDIHYIYTVEVSVNGEEELVLSRAKNASAAIAERFEYRIPQVAGEFPNRPVVIGFGPAGMFAALVLAEAGLAPIVLERGADAVTRKAKVDLFWGEGVLDPECNVQFGEGGAGTFSDGKLNTERTKDPRIHWVLQQFAAAGAPVNICYDAKPHIGTDILIDVVQNLRKRIIAAGGEVRFGHKLVGLGTEEQISNTDDQILNDENFTKSLSAITVQSPDGTYTLSCERLILAIGHSARDTLEMLEEIGVPMEPKPFSMGVRIEHSQTMVDQTQYRNGSGDLPPADYKLACQLPDGGSAYTFCMCPGGYVVAAASEEGGVVTNGMSFSMRDAENANAALLVTLHPEDFPDKSILGGMRWQREIERAAFEAGGKSYKAPAQIVGDFLANRASSGVGRANRATGKVVRPTYRPGVIWGDIRTVLPQKITNVIAEALPLLDRKLRGFADPGAVMTAPETRSSSPVRILRGEDRSSALAGLYPCGEGAGYAGGITSAAVDGVRCAEAVIGQIRKIRVDPR